MIKKLQEGWREESQYISSYNDPAIYWTTFDLGCTSALISSGFDLAKLEKSNPRKVQFVFYRKHRDGIVIEKVAADYFADRLMVRGRAYFDNLKMLKNRIYSE